MLSVDCGELETLSRAPPQPPAIPHVCQNLGYYILDKPIRFETMGPKTEKPHVQFNGPALPRR